MLADGTYDKDGNAKAYTHGFQVGIWDQPINVNKTHKNLERKIKERTKTCDAGAPCNNSLSGIGPT